jgi:hypothetical protein
MIRASLPGAALVQRLQARANRIAATRVASARRDRRTSGPDWRSATDLWPDFFNRD